MVKEIQLNQGKICLVDEEDYDWLKNYRWEAIKINGKTHAVTVINGEGYLMEDVIMDHTLKPYQRKNMK